MYYPHKNANQKEYNFPTEFHLSISCLWISLILCKCFLYIFFQLWPQKNQPTNMQNWIFIISYFKLIKIVLLSTLTQSECILQVYIIILYYYYYWIYKSSICIDTGYWVPPKYFYSRCTLTNILVVDSSAPFVKH